MKKYILILALLPTFLFADVIKDYQKEYPYLNNFKAESKTRFKIKAMNEMVFTVHLSKNSQYCFIAEGSKDFHFQIMEVSGITESGWEGIFSRNNRIISLENTQEIQTYKIKVYTFSDNDITLYWGKY